MSKELKQVGTKKVAVRNCEVPVNELKEHSTDSLDSNDANICEESNVKEPQTQESNVVGSGLALVEPGVCSSLKIAKDITKAKHFGISRKSLVKKTINKAFPVKKVNIPFDEQVYKDLIDLKIRDEDLGFHPNHPVKAKEFAKAKDPEPVLSDFFKPSFDKEYTVKIEPSKLEIKKQWTYSGFSISNAMKKWDPL